MKYKELDEIKRCINKFQIGKITLQRLAYQIEDEITEFESNNTKKENEELIKSLWCEWGVIQEKSGILSLYNLNNSKVLTKNNVLGNQHYYTIETLEDAIKNSLLIIEKFENNLKINYI